MSAIIPPAGRPFVSVIICFYNDERFLSEAIDSVIAQSYSHLELILVDDGSSDSSTSIAKQYSEKYGEKVRYVDQPMHANKGLSESRNLGIHHSRGEIVSFLDSDDIYLPDYLQNQVQIFEKFPEAAMICEATDYWYSWRDSKLQDRIIQVGAPQDKLYEPPQLAAILYPLAKGDAPCTCGTVVRRWVLEKHGGFEPKFTGMYEDQAFLIKIYLSEKVFISSVCNNRYRQRPESMMNSANREGRYHSFRQMFFIWLKNYLRSIGYNNKQIWRLVSSGSWRYRFPLLYKGKKLVEKIEHRIFKLRSR